MLLDYMAAYPNVRMCFVAGTMQLLVESDAAYLVLPNVKSRIAGHYMLASKPKIHNQHKSPLNAPIPVESKTIKNVVCSEAEAECGGLFYNGQMAKTIRQILTDMDIHKIQHNSKSTIRLQMILSMQRCDWKGVRHGTFDTAGYDKKRYVNYSTSYGTKV